MTGLTTAERDRIARAIYEACTVQAGYGDHVKTWTSMRDWEKHRWQRAADRAWAHMHVIAGVRLAEKAA